MTREGPDPAGRSHRRPLRRGPTRPGWIIVAALTLAGLAGIAAAQSGGGDQSQRIAITGERLTGIVLPVTPRDGDVEIAALRAWRWTVGDTKRLLLEQDVRITIGDHRFEADRAVLWLNRIPSDEGLINQLALYLENATNARSTAGIGVEGERVLVTGSARGGVRLAASRLVARRPAGDPLVRAGEAALADHLRAVAALAAGAPRTDVELTARPQVRELDRARPFRPAPGATIPPPPEPGPGTVALPERAAEQPLPLVVPDGWIRVAAEEIVLEPGERENALIAIGRLVVTYTAGRDAGGSGAEWSRLTLTARRAVVFLAPGTVESYAGRALDVEDVHGVYLEGDVLAMADDGAYVLRAPRAYYDFTTGQALILDAVLRTYARDDRVPVYARAAEMRQIAANQWESRRATVSTSSFFVPHLAIGADRTTITEFQGDETPGGRTGTWVESSGNTLEALGVPVLAWPRFSGRADRDRPLRSLSVGYEDNDGVQLETEWDLYSLLGRERPRRTEARLKLDGYTRRGVGTGVEVVYDRSFGRGLLDLYGMYDDGTDRTSSGRDVEQDGELRGVALAEHVMDLGANWTLASEFSYISDPTFITARRENDFDERREYRTAARLQWLDGPQVFGIEAAYELNDFISNSYLLASRQYQVDRMPEAYWAAVGVPIGSGGLLYNAEARAGRVRLAIDESTSEQLGVPGRAFGIPDDEPLIDAARARGLNTRWLGRADTRHELSMKLSAGPLSIVPFVVGRFTAYSEDDVNLTSDDEKYQWFGSTGVTVSTQIQRVWDGVESRLLDIHRLRNVIEPMLTVWYADASRERGDLIVYDETVEPLQASAAIRLGVRVRWQTQRGGPGAWRSVDVLDLQGDVVFDSGDADRSSPTPEWIEWRPEYSRAGDHVRGRAAWAVADGLTLVGEGTYDLEHSLMARTSVGAELRHSPNLSTFIEYREIEASDNELLQADWTYQLSTKYRVSFGPQWDFVEDEFRAFRFLVARAFPDYLLELQFRRDEIRDDTSISASVRLVDF